MSEIINEQMLKNPAITRFPENQSQWHDFVREMAKFTVPPDDVDEIDFTGPLVSTSGLEASIERLQIETLIAQHDRASGLEQRLEDARLENLMGL